MASAAPKALTGRQLRQRCDPAALRSTSSEQVEQAPGPALVGQERGLRALRLAVEMRGSDFNLFVLGPPGTGRHTAVHRVLREQVASRELPPDWAYVNNFDAPHRPVALRLPAGMADRLRQEMERVVDDLASDIPALFESDEYQTQRRAIDEEFGERQEQAMAEFAERARKEDVAVVRTPMGYMVAATRDGEALKTEDYNKLPEEEQEKIDEKIPRFQEGLTEVLSNAPKLEREHRARVEALNAEMAERAVSGRITEAEAALGNGEEIQPYLARVREDMIANPELFLQTTAQMNEGLFPEPLGKSHREPAFGRYMVNVVVANTPGPDATAPIETEDLPTLDRLVGRIEHVSHMGSLITDFTLIRPGALHRANGGFLVLDARRVLSEPFAWDALKRSLKKRAITITSLAERMSLMSTTSLEPDPIPLDLRVILVGDRLLYALLVMLDPDFSELFKIQADFEDNVDRDSASLAGLAGLIRSYAAQEGLLPPEDTGVARLLDEATRIAEDSQKLSLRLSQIADILREAEHYARMRGQAEIAAEDVDRAVEERDRRGARIRDRTHEAITRETLMIDTDGEKVGQINGLSVVGLGDHRFGRPSRITARTRMGTGKLIDIEREVELGGPLHSKGVMILAGYLTSTYALDVPFSLHASLVFEQSYGGIDGDSASCAELIALLSALSHLPIRQDLAITGSVNQLGEVQAIGGVNEKIEGFFDICARRGLTGDQGVLIPVANVAHLMLRDRVVEAAEAGRFRIIPIAKVDQAMELLTGTPAGARTPEGDFEADSVNARIEAQLQAFAQARRAFAARSEEPDPGGLA
ncbi:MAG: AAA family ATPase [Litoreibacter sp.]|nr:AAA family ATPase [Litoreibacter sp.]